MNIDRRSKAPVNFLRDKDHDQLPKKGNRNYRVFSKNLFLNPNFKQ